MSVVREKGLDGVVPFRFACHRCGHCCSAGTGFVWLEDGEIERMAAQLGTTSEAFARRHVRRAIDPRTGEQRLALRETANEGGRCALLVGRNTCSVYDARPEHCRSFPYWDTVLTDEAAFEAARATCPGIAVEVDADVRARAFAALSQLYESLEGTAEPSACCLAGSRADVTFATALEADYALAAPPDPASPCHLGDRRPIACRTVASPADGAGEELVRRVRAIERENGYPAAYSALSLLLAARGGETTLRVMP